MKQIENLKILGIDIAGPNKFLVVTQCDGSCYEQNYPKMIRHSFRFENKSLYKFDDGERLFIKKMRKLYTIQNTDIKRFDYEKGRPDESIEKVVEKLNEEWTDYEI